MNRLNVCANLFFHFFTNQDWKLVSSISATERIKLWDQFSGPVDQETIKSEFLRKVHCKNPPFRYKVKPKPRICAEIPPMVEYHYKHPPPLLPSLRDILRCERVYKRPHCSELSNPELCTELDKNISEFKEAQRKIQRFEIDLVNTSPMETDEVKDENDTPDNAKLSSDTPKNIDFSANTPTAEQLETAAENEPTTTTMTAAATVTATTTTAVQVIPEPNKIQTVDDVDSTKILNGDGGNAPLSENNEKLLAQQLQNTKSVANSRTTSNRRKRHTSTKSLGLDCAEMLDLAADAFKAKWQNETIDANQIDNELKCLDLDVIKELAFRQLQQILNENTDLVAKYQANAANKAIKEALKSMPIKIALPSQLLTSDDIARIAEQFASGSSSSDTENDDDTSGAANNHTNGINRSHVPLAAPTPHLMQLNGFDHLDSDTEKALAIARRLEEPLRDSKVRARAVLTPVTDILEGKRWFTDTTIDDSIFMRYRNLSIGTDRGCQLKFKPMRKCARLSSHHASIFFDEVSRVSPHSQFTLIYVSVFVLQVTKVYELLNYSEFGSEVNGQLYSCDFTEYPQLNENRIQDVNGFYENIRNILDKKRGVQRIDYKPDQNTR